MLGRMTGASTRAFKGIAPERDSRPPVSWPVSTAPGRTHPDRVKTRRLAREDLVECGVNLQFRGLHNWPTDSQ